MDNGHVEIGFDIGKRYDNRQDKYFLSWYA